MKQSELDKIEQDGQEIAEGFHQVIEKKFGTEALMKDALQDFLMESAAVGYAVNYLNSVLASLVIERLVEQGDSIEKAQTEVAAMMAEDAKMAAKEGGLRFQTGLAAAKAMMEALPKQKKYTSH